MRLFKKLNCFRQFPKGGGGTTNPKWEIGKLKNKKQNKQNKQHNIRDKNNNKGHFLIKHYKHYKTD